MIVLGFVEYKYLDLNIVVVEKIKGIAEVLMMYGEWVCFNGMGMGMRMVSFMWFVIMIASFIQFSSGGWYYYYLVIHC